MKLKALKNISDQTRAGDVFEAPDLILVHMGLATVVEPDTADDPQRPPRRRGYHRRDMRAEE